MGYERMGRKEVEGRKRRKRGYDGMQGIGKKEVGKEEGEKEQEKRQGKKEERRRQNRKIKKLV